jgi:hypothetical protein
MADGSEECECGQRDCTVSSTFANSIWHCDSLIDAAHSVLALSGTVEFERETSYEYVKLNEEWQRHQSVLCDTVARLFQYENRVVGRDKSTLRKQLLQSKFGNDVDKLRASGRWGFEAVPNPQGIHITLASSASHSKRGKNTKSKRKPRTDRDDSVASFRIVRLRHYTPPDIGQRFRFDERLFVAHLFAFVVQFDDEQLSSTAKDHHISFACYGFRLH